MRSKANDSFVRIDSGLACPISVDRGRSRRSANDHRHVRQESYPRQFSQPDRPQTPFVCVSRCAGTISGGLAALPATPRFDSAALGFTTATAAREQYVRCIKYGGSHNRDVPRCTLRNGVLLHALHSEELLSDAQATRAQAYPLPLIIPVIEHPNVGLTGPSEHGYLAQKCGKHELKAFGAASTCEGGVGILELAASLTTMSELAREAPQEPAYDQHTSMLLSQVESCCRPVLTRAKAAPMELWRAPILPLPSPSVVLSPVSRCTHLSAMLQPHFEHVRLAEGELDSCIRALADEGQAHGHVADCTTTGIATDSNELCCVELDEVDGRVMLRFRVLDPAQHKGKHLAASQPHSVDS